MTFTISKRGMVRLVSFSAAIILVLGLWAIRASRNSRQNQLALEHYYMQSMSNLSTHVQNIDSDLQKILYAKTPQMLSFISSKLWREAGFAKSAMDALPIEYLSLQNTNKLLSQVGDYCVSLSREFLKGNPVTPEQRQNLLKLHGYCDTMLSEVLAANDGMVTGSVSMTEVKGNIDHSFDGAPAPANVSEGFSEFEEGFTAYPTLIYDGPFSDHIMEKTPARLKEENAIPRAKAREIAAKASGLRETQLTEGSDEEGKMPSYSFTGDGVDLSITKEGGFLCTMMRSRLVQESLLTKDNTLKKAIEFLKSMGYASMRPTYFEIAGNEMTINFAYVQDGVLCYTDLIKVTAAMDNGEITGFDARGFLTNNSARQGLKPAISETKGRQSVSELLTVESSQLCLIPSAGLNEVLCWEYKCKSEQDETILVYVNAATGAEEQILILYIGENGQLTI